MKKILFVLTVLLLATPAMASVTINAVQSATEPCDVYITYVNTEGPNVRAFALDIWVDDGNILAIEDYNVGECNSTVQGFGIFMGTIVIDTAGVVTNDGTPVAELADLPGDTLPGPDSNGVTTEMGSLYETGVVPGPKQTGTLYRVRVSKVPCNLCIRTNVSRAGIVLENGDSSEDDTPSFTTNLPLCEAIAGGGPCPGDCEPVDTGDDDMDIYDYNKLRGQLRKAYSRTGVYYISPTDPCEYVRALWTPALDCEPWGVGDVDVDIYDFNKLRGQLRKAYSRTGLYYISPTDPCEYVRALWPCP